MMRWAGWKGTTRDDVYLGLGLIDPLRAVQFSMPFIRVLFEMLDHTVEFVLF